MISNTICILIPEFFRYCSNTDMIAGNCVKRDGFGEKNFLAANAIHLKPGAFECTQIHTGNSIYGIRHKINLPSTFLMYDLSANH